MLLLVHLDVFEQSRETYGSYRIYIELREQSIRGGRKRVACLMQEVDLEPKTVRPIR